jgi:uncharacterized protein (TIGR00369 family)
MEEIVKYSHCFVCGDQNRHGLQAKFFWDGREASSELVASDSFEGYRGIFHGGLIATMLDEVMIKAILAQDIYAVTAEMTVRYHRPVETGQELRFVGRMTEGKGRMYYAEGEAVGPDGTVFASSTGKYIQAKPELKTRLLDSIDG